MAFIVLLIYPCFYLCTSLQHLVTFLRQGQQMISPAADGQGRRLVHKAGVDGGPLIAHGGGFVSHEPGDAAHDIQVMKIAVGALAFQQMHQLLVPHILHQEVMNERRGGLHGNNIRMLKYKLNILNMNNSIKNNNIDTCFSLQNEPVKNSLYW